MTRAVVEADRVILLKSGPLRFDLSRYANNFSRLRIKFHDALDHFRTNRRDLVEIFEHVLNVETGCNFV